MRYKNEYRIPIPITGYKSGVYCFHCLENDRYYIGSSHLLRERLQDHNNCCKHGEHNNPSIQADYNSGLHFETFILYDDKNHKLNRDALKIIEYSCIKYFFEHGYNLYNFNVCTGSEKAKQLLINNVC